MNTIICKNCGQAIEVDKALEGQIEARVLAAEHQKHTVELAKVTAEAESNAQRHADAAVEMARKATAIELDIAKKQLAAEAILAEKRAASEREVFVQGLRDDADSEKKLNAKLREQLAELMQTLRGEKQARAQAELEAQKKLAAEETKIREEVSKNADEKYRLKIAEHEKKLADTQKALEEAQRKASQGSQQNQGEVLELDLENRLRDAFPSDDILEIKKGMRGADVRQVVRDQIATECGVLLWETKNGKWQPAWVAKFKQDIREANANLGVLVSQEMPREMGTMHHLEANVWVVSPGLAPALAAALRATILQVNAANKMNAGKDIKMESLYQFLVGPEFRYRVEAIVENYGMLQAEIEKEKRAAALRWAHQEKSIRAVIDNTIGMYGDLQGITNRALPAIRQLEFGPDD